MAKQPTPQVKPGPVYEHIRYSKRIRITDYRLGTNRADVVDAVTGKRPRSILLSELHATNTTRDGRPRRTGSWLRRRDGSAHV